jgi:quercetin dioxygenase-like cupin family protein
MAERAIGPLLIRDHISSNMAVLMKKGGVVEGHQHNFGHASPLFKGGVIVRKWSPDKKVLLLERELWAPGWIGIEAGYWHSFESLADGTIMQCAWPHRNPDGTVSEEYTGWILAYG